MSFDFPVSAYIKCPICQEALELQQKSVVCKNRHAFDYASAGYVHLLPSNQMRTKIPGDDAKMVNARHSFLNCGYYSCLCDALSHTLCDLASQKTLSVLDIGCGEGYYTQAFSSALMAKGMTPYVVGIDISKHALKLAAKRFQNICCPSFFSVASAYHLPLQNETMEAAVNVFSPLATEEIYRVLKKDGYFFYVVPAARHLWQLKEILYDVPYENKEEKTDYLGFVRKDCVSIRTEIEVIGQESIQALFSMTPYYWRSPKAGAQRLQSCDVLKTQVEFDLWIYQKK